MGIGSGWAGSPWGGGLELAGEPIPGQLYDVVLATEDVSFTDASSIAPLIPEFLAGAESAIKVGVVFTQPMTGAALNPANYTVIEAEGLIPVPVMTVTISGSSSVYKVDLGLGAELSSKDFYILKLNPVIVSQEGVPPATDSYVFQWADMSRPTVGRPLEIPIKDFSGEVSGGILGTPDGLVFFSPAYEPVLDTSTIEVSQVSVCTKAYDEYHLPAIPDPTPFATFGGLKPGLLGDPNFVLWAKADRLGQALWNLLDTREDAFEAADDGNEAIGTLVEPIDITRASFLNDARWRTFPGGGQTVFATASNLTPIGPGPTQVLTLEPA